MISLLRGCTTHNIHMQAAALIFYTPEYIPALQEEDLGPSPTQTIQLCPDSSGLYVTSLLGDIVEYIKYNQTIYQVPHHGDCSVDAQLKYKNTICVAMGTSRKGVDLVFRYPEKNEFIFREKKRFPCARSGKSQNEKFEAPPEV